MREATGGSLLLYIVLFFVGVIILFFASIMSYSKAYRVKNRIINVVEGSDCETSDDVLFNKLISSINEDLEDVGYSFTKTASCTFNNDVCNEPSKGNFNVSTYGIGSNKGGAFNYCICTQKKFPLIMYFKVMIRQRRVLFIFPSSLLILIFRRITMASN